MWTAIPEKRLVSDRCNKINSVLTNIICMTCPTSPSAMAQMNSRCHKLSCIRRILFARHSSPVNPSRHDAEVEVGGAVDV